MSLQTEARPIVERMKDLQHSLGFNQLVMAEYLGVPYRTYVNWMQGTRQPNKAVERLVAILEAVRLFAPGLHSNLTPKRVEKEIIGETHQT